MGDHPSPRLANALGVAARVARAGHTLLELHEVGHAAELRVRERLVQPLEDRDRVGRRSVGDQVADSREADRILALEIGADDFLIKPISGRELVARVRAHLRRAAAAAPAAGEAKPRWRFSLPERLLYRPDSSIVPLTAAEFELLAQLLETPNQPVDRETLTRRVFMRPWRSEERAIDNLVLHLRQKLGPGGERSIVTIRNQGYAFTAFPDV